MCGHCLVQNGDDDSGKTGVSERCGLYVVTVWSRMVTMTQVRLGCVKGVACMWSLSGPECDDNSGKTGVM